MPKLFELVKQLDLQISQHNDLYDDDIDDNVDDVEEKENDDWIVKPNRAGAAN